MDILFNTGNTTSPQYSRPNCRVRPPSATSQPTIHSMSCHHLPCKRNTNTLTQNDKVLADMYHVQLTRLWLSWGSMAHHCSLLNPMQVALDPKAIISNSSQNQYNMTKHTLILPYCGTLYMPLTALLHPSSSHTFEL